MDENRGCRSQFWAILNYWPAKSKDGPFSPAMLTSVPSLIPNNQALAQQTDPGSLAQKLSLNLFRSPAWLWNLAFSWMWWQLLMDHNHKTYSTSLQINDGRLKHLISHLKKKTLVHKPKLNSHSKCGIIQKLLCAFVMRIQEKSTQKVHIFWTNVQNKLHYEKMFAKVIHSRQNCREKCN